MHALLFLHSSIAHQLFGVTSRRLSRPAHPIGERDRGAVSLEQVLWFVAAGVSVAVIAAILWAQIKDRADDPITPPVAP